MKIIRTDEDAVVLKYKCCVCQKGFNWDENSMWYGSLIDWDKNEFDKLKIVCSQECADKLTPADK